MVKIRLHQGQDLQKLFKNLLDQALLAERKDSLVKSYKSKRDHNRGPNLKIDFTKTKEKHQNNLEVPNSKQTLNLCSKINSK